VLELSADDIVGLPVDRLALAVLKDYETSGEWHEWNYINGYLQSSTFRQRQDALQALSEALGWLRSTGMLTRSPQSSDASALTVSRAGRRALNGPLETVRAELRLREGLHPSIEQIGRAQFLLGGYELAVFACMKAVEVRVRSLAGEANEVIGVNLMNRAFGPTGPLTDRASTTGEQEGMRCLFAGAYAVLRNPAGHVEVNYDDVAEAADAVATASLLMRILDAVERRLDASDGDGPAPQA
jgi:uncharacterized protein (TIGR02391 family)